LSLQDGSYIPELYQVMIDLKHCISLVPLLLASAVCWAQKPELVVQTGHSETVNSVAFSPDGKTLASGSEDHTIKLWEVTTGRVLRTLTGHSDGVNSVAFSPDGKRLASGGDDKTIKLWDVSTGTELHTLTGLGHWILSVTFSPDGRLLASGNDYGGIELWDVASGTRLHETGVELHSGTYAKAPEFCYCEVRSVVFSPDGKTLASGTGSAFFIKVSDYPVDLWDVASLTRLRTLAHHSLGIRSVAFSPDGKVLASGSEDQTIKLWDVKSGRELRMRMRQSLAVNSVAFSPDGKTLASVSDDKTIKLWEAASGSELRTLRGHSAPGRLVAFSPDGKTLASGSGDETIKLWDVASGNELLTLRGHSYPVNSVAFSSDGKSIASSSWGTIKLWEAASGAQLRAVTGGSRPLTSVTFSPDGKTLAGAGSHNEIEVWDVSSGTRLRLLTGHAQSVTSIAFNPDGKTLASGSDNEIKLWDLASGGELQTFKGNFFGNSLTFSPDGKILARGNQSGTVKLWNVASGTELRVLNTGTIKLWDVPNQLSVLRGHDCEVTSVAFSPDGKILASASGDDPISYSDRFYGVPNEIMLWEVASGRELHTLTEHADEVTSVAFSPDGKTLASGSSDQTIKLWDVKSGSELHALKGHSHEVTSVAFSPDGMTLASGSVDGQIRLWQVQSGREIASLIALDQNDWVVIDPLGRFDGSANGMKLLHFVVGLEPIELDQLKEKYHEPGLLPKLLGYDTTPFLLNVNAFTDVKLYPKVELAEPAETTSVMRIKLTNQGGGIGPVKVFVNGSEQIGDAREPGFNPDKCPDKCELTLRVDLKRFERFLQPNEDNDITVVAYSKDNLPSRGETIKFKPLSYREIKPPQFWAVFAGVSKYQQGERKDIKDLRFAAKDAQTIAQAFRVAGERLFPGRVHITTLSTESEKPEEQPTKDNIIKALKELAANPQVNASDILLFYVAGHGVSYGGAEGDYYYLTSKAFSANLKDEDIRNQTALSGKEIEDWIIKIPTRKRVLILDTCAAGRFTEELEKPRAVDGVNQRAWERMQDRTGLWVLAGSASDSVSYESSRYGQGILTYSLLQGMKRDWEKVLEVNERSRLPELVDVAKLFNYSADEVPKLAGDNGGIQKPRVLSKQDARSFAIGRITAIDRKDIPLPLKKPVYLRSNFQLESRPGDPFDLTSRLDEQLRNLSDRGIDATLVFWDVPKHPGTYRISGRYTLDADGTKMKELTVFISMAVQEGEKLIETDLGAPFSVQCDKTKPDELVMTILQEVAKRIPAPSP
jgi:WD40 repeat protein